MNINFYDIDWALFNEVLEDCSKDVYNAVDMLDLYENEFAEHPTKYRYKELVKQYEYIGRLEERKKVMNDVYDFLLKKFWEA